MTNEPALYKPGDTVPQTGVYDVTHDNLDGQEHTPPHPVTALRGKLFPPCRACHEQLSREYSKPIRPIISMWGNRGNS